jgi:hypothetical protein
VFDPGADWLEKSYTWSILVWFAAIPLSKAAGSLAEGWMALSWLLGLLAPGVASERLQRWKEQPWLWGFPGLYLLYVAGGWHSEDLQGWTVELNAKHYWCTLPLMWGTWTPKARVFRHALWGFVGANALAGMGIAFIHLSGSPLLEGTPAIPSPLVQRPRASLFLAFSLLWIFESVGTTGTVTLWRTWFWWQKTLLGAAILLCLLGLLWLQGRIGQLALLLGLTWMAWRHLHASPLRWWIPVATATLALLAWFTLESVRIPFQEAWMELQESQKGYPHSEPEFSSIGMRFTYWSTYLEVWKNHFWLGVGSGDLDLIGRPLFDDHPLEIPFHRPHNQWLEAGVQLGLTGFLGLALAWGLWVARIWRGKQVLAEALTLIFGLSTLLDCTFSTQAGISAFMGLHLALMLAEQPTAKAAPFRPGSLPPVP